MEKIRMMKTWIFLAVIFAVMTGSGMSAYASIKPASETAAPALMEVSAVYGDVGKNGNHIPISVTVNNQTEHQLCGTLDFYTDEEKNEYETERFEYSYPLEIGPMSSSTDQYEILLGQKSNEIQVVFRDEEGEVLSRKELRFDIQREIGKLYIGVLDDDIRGIRYLDHVSLNYNTMYSQLIGLDDSIFPDNSLGLEMLDIVLINNFRTASLSGEQLSALWQWVEDGGILLFGTGARSVDTLGPFARNLVEVPYDMPEMTSVSMSAEYSDQSPVDVVVEMVCGNFTVPGGEEILTSDELPLLTMTARGSGKAGIFAFDLSDLSEFISNNPSYLVHMITSIVGENKLNSLYYYSTNGQEQDYWNAGSLVETGNTDRLPNIPLYGGLILIYVVVAGPGLYLFLKKHGDRKYYGTFLVFTSLVFSAVIYLVGVKTRFRSEFYTFASIREVSREEENETVFLNISTPDSRAYSVEIDSQYQISPLNKVPMMYQETIKKTYDPEERADFSIRYGEDSTLLSVRRSEAFEPRFFRLDRTGDNETGEGLTADLTLFDHEFMGTVTNHFPFPVENAIILMHSQVLPLGTLKPGETRTLDGESPLIYAADMPYLVSDYLAGAGEDSAEAVKSRRQSNLYAYYLGKYYIDYTPEVRICGFGPSEAAEEMADHVFGMTLYTSPVDLNMEKDGFLYRSGAAKRPKLSSEGQTYYQDYSGIYGNETVVMEYNLGSDIEIEKISFLPVEPTIIRGENLSYIDNFYGEAAFYNYESKTYDKVDLSRVDFDKEELWNYLSPSNVLKVRYTGGEPEGGKNLLLPILMVTGRDR